MRNAVINYAYIHLSGRHGGINCVEVRLVASKDLIKMGKFID